MLGRLARDPGQRTRIQAAAGLIDSGEAIADLAHARPSVHLRSTAGTSPPGRESRSTARLPADLRRSLPNPVRTQHLRAPGRSSLAWMNIGNVQAVSYYHQLFEALCARYQLVFVGFCFADPYLKHVAVEPITMGAARTMRGPRHVAIIGLSKKAEITHLSGGPFPKGITLYCCSIRLMLQTDGGEDQGPLLEILDRPSRIAPGDSSRGKDAPFPGPRSFKS